MSRFFLLCSLFFLVAQPAFASWGTLGSFDLAVSSSSATFTLDKELDPVDAIRFQITGGTVALGTLFAIPKEGKPIALNTPRILKSGENSGRIRIPGKAVELKSLKLQYRVIHGQKAKIMFRLKHRKHTVENKIP